MKRLYLLRHAKSSWADPGLEDFDRPLNARGQRTAPQVALFLRQAGHCPELVLCSAARRAEDTWRLMAPTLGGAPEVRILKGLYMAPPSTLLAFLRRLPDSLGCVMVIGHNPGLEETARRLAGSGKKAALEQLNRKFPTAALAVLDLKIDRWQDTEAGCGELLELAIPARDPA